MQKKNGADSTPAHKLSRREFLRMTGVAGAGLIAAGLLAVQDMCAFRVHRSLFA